MSIRDFGFQIYKSCFNEEHLFFSCADKTSPTSPNNGAVGGISSMSGKENNDEKYEKGVPIHGDMMFHNFVVTLQNNPGQIIRYNFDWPLILKIAR